MAINLTKGSNKSRSDVKTVQVPNTEQHNASHTVTGGFSHAALPTDQWSEAIRSGYGRNHFNNCFHEYHRTRYMSDPSWGITLYNTAGFHYHDYYGFHNHGYGAHSAAYVEYATALSSEVAALDFRALSATAMPRLEPSLQVVSIPNFLLELRDLRRMFEFWRHDSSLAKNAASAHLNWSFGWKPFLGDLQRTYSALQETQTKLKDWDKKVSSGKPQTRSTSLESLTTELGGTFNYGGDASRPCTWNASHKRHVTAWLKFKPLPTKLSAGLSRDIAAMAQALGIAPNVSILWDAIPFSFVVDWFFNVGSAIEKLDIDVLDLPFTLMDFAIQSKVIANVSSQLKLFVGQPTWSQVVVCPKWETVDEYFTRTVMYPDTDLLSGLGWQVPRWDKATKLVSLFVANR